MTQESNMRSLVLVLAVAVGWGACLLSCGGGSTPGAIPEAEACPQAARSVCARVFSCPDQLLQLAQFALGGSETACQAMVQQNYCGAFQCMAGQTYHGDKAAQCKQQFSTVSCATLATALSMGGAAGGVAAVLTSVPACQQVCSNGADASATGG
jgi:hypothetical protein